MSNLKRLMPFVAILALIASCGGSSSGGSGSGTDSGTTTVNSISDVPDDVINPQAYDLTTQTTSLSAPINKGIGKAVQAGGFSRAGCETDTLKKNIIRNAILPRMILCKMSAMETAAGGTAAGSGVFNYWKLGAGAEEEGGGPNGVESFDPRVAIKKDGSTFTFVMCNGTTKTMEMYIDSTSGYNGHVIDKWGTSHEGSLSFNTDGLPPNNFTLARFTQSFVEDSDYFSGYGSATLDATPTFNAVYGFNSGRAPDGGTFAGATFAKFDLDEGTAKYRMDSGSYPAQTVAEAFSYCKAEGNCNSETASEWIDPVNGWLVNGTPCSLGALTVESKLCWGGGDCPTLADENDKCSITGGTDYIESFTINNTDPLNLVFAMADTSSYAVDVAAATAPSSATAPTIAFTDVSAVVDCSTSDSWTQLSLSVEPDFTECVAMETEMNSWQSGEICADQQAEDNAGKVQQ